jgi:hypothetical protein
VLDCRAFVHLSGKAYCRRKDKAAAYCGDLFQKEGNSSDRN